MKGVQGMPIYSGDRLSSLANGRSHIKTSEGIHLELIDESNLVFNLKSDHLKKFSFSEDQRAYLERGKLLLKVPDGKAYIVWTPHVVVYSFKGEVELWSTDLNSMIQARGADLVYASLISGKEERLKGDARILINDAGQIDTLPDTQPNQSGEQ